MKATAQFQTESEVSGPASVTPLVRQAAESPSAHAFGFSSRVGREQVLAVKLCVSAKTRDLIDPLDCDWKRERKAKINTKPSTASTTSKSANGAAWPASA